MTKKSGKVWFFLLMIIFLVHLFLRFYEMGTRNPFGWDQVDNAWAAKDMIVDKKWPLVGMAAKLNSGFNIGPAYYYLIVPFYWIFNLDPMASGIFAGVTSIFTFWTIYYFTQKLFSQKVALAAVFIHTVSYHVIHYNRIQWPVNFITPISLIIFYALYRVLIGKEKYLLLLAGALGFSFHIHFTSIFYPLILLFSLPLAPRTKKFFKYALISAPLFFIWLAPIFLVNVANGGSQSSNMAGYLQTYYHGLHGVRVLQLAKDAFIEFESILFFPKIKILKFILLPLFLAGYYFSCRTRERLVMAYLASLWFLAPWLAFSVYSGEISNYYFFITRPLVVIVMACLTVWVLETKKLPLKLLIVFFWIYYAFFNLKRFALVDERGVDFYKKSVRAAIQAGKKIEFQHGNPESYLYYIWAER